MLAKNIQKNLGYLQANLFHLVALSLWLIYTTFSIFALLLNLLLISHNYCDFHWVLLINLITVIYASLLWGRDIIAEATYLGDHTLRVRNGLYTGYVIFLGTELLVFIGFFWAYFHSALSLVIELGEMWLLIGITAIQLTDLLLLNTLILLASGATITYSHHGLIGDDWTASVYGLLFTIILGVLFIICQFIEYTYCTYTIADGVYGSTFFFLTGLHGLHLIGGTFFLSLSFYRLYTLQMTSTHHLGYETTILLWHFLDVVWLFLYIICYYWGT